MLDLHRVYPIKDDIPDMQWIDEATIGAVIKHWGIAVIG
jgi:hypothetical protein